MAAEFGSDLRYSFRALRRDPRFALAVVLILALGIGAATTTFSVVNAVLLRPLPLDRPEDLVVIWRRSSMPGLPRGALSGAAFLDLRKQNEVFTDVAALFPAELTLSGGSEPEHLFGFFVSPQFLALAGSQPALGRTFSSKGDAARSEVVVSHALWQRRFGGDPSAIGRSVMLDGRPYVIVGVMPLGFAFPPYLNPNGGIVPKQIDVWVPIDVATDRIEDWELSRRDLFLFALLARLQPGVSRERAQANLDAIAARLGSEYPDTDKDAGFVAVPLLDGLVGDFRRTLLALVGAVTLVLLIVSANGASLLLSRAITRERELAIRATLGASRRRLVRQLLFESMLLALAAGVAGVLLAWLADRALGGLMPPTIPQVGAVGLDLRVLGLTIAVTLTTGIGFGIGPAFQAARPNLEQRLREGSRSAGTSSRIGALRDGLAVVEIALAVVILVGAGLLLQSFLRLRAADQGYVPTGLVTFRVRLDRAHYPDPSAQTRFFQQLIREVSALPGVTSVGAVDALPFTQDYASWQFEVEGYPEPRSSEPEALYHTVSPGFFQTFDIGLEQGRYFIEADGRAEPKVAVVNRAMVQRYFHGENPIGKRVKVISDSVIWREVVGVVDDIRYVAPENEPVPQLYALYTQPYPEGLANQMTVALRTTGDLPSVGASVRRSVAAIDKDQPIHDLKMMEQYFDEAVARRRFSLAILATFASLALIIAAVGVYGVIGYGVSRRTHEIGLRVALGARPGHVFKLVISHTAVLGGIGVAIGLVVSLALSRTFTGLLYETSATDLATYLAVATASIGVSLLAGFLPTRRALTISPLVAIRQD